jgi:RHS repeat-associated protein
VVILSLLAFAAVRTVTGVGGGGVAKRWGGGRRWIGVLAALAVVALDFSVVPPRPAAPTAASSDPIDGTKASPLPAQSEPPKLKPTKPDGDPGPGAPPIATVNDSKTKKDYKGFDTKTSKDIPERKTARTEVFANADGSFTAHVDSMPTRFKDEKGDWQQIDLSLEKKPDGKLKSKASGRDVSVLPDPTQGLVQWDSPGGPVVFSLPDVAMGADKPKKATEPVSPVSPDPNRDKERTAKWDNPIGGPSVAAKLTVTGFEQDVIVPSAVEPSSYRFTVSLPAGWTARRESAVVRLVDAAGNVQATFGGGRAYDAKSKVPAQSGETPVTTTLVGELPGQAIVEVGIDPVWLADPARVFPVVIDPSLEVPSYGDGGQDTYVDYFQPDSSFYGEDQLRVGVWPYSVDNALLSFNLGGIPVSASTTVTESHLSLFNTAANGADGHKLRMFGLGDGGWAIFPGVTWATQPPTDGKVMRGEWDGIWGDNGFGGCGCFVELDTKSIAKSWLHEGQPNDGLQLTANLSDPASGKMFYSGDSGWYAPRFEVTYFEGPPQATPVSPANESNTSSLTPTLTVNDIGGGMKYYFRVATGSDAESGSILANSDWLDTPTWTVPEGILRDGGTYYWHAWTFNGFAWTEANWAWRFTANRRLGTDTPSPYDASGPVNVNLATGNLIAQTSSPSFKTVGGDVGLTYTYNSQQLPPQGLRGSYYNCTGLDCQVDMTTLDPAIWFGWPFSPGVGINPDGWSARWTGYLTVPWDGLFQIGAQHDDGVRIWVDNNLVVDNWQIGSFSGLDVGGSVYLRAGQPVPIRIEHFDFSSSAYLLAWIQVSDHPETAIPVIPNWLSPEAPALPGGWNVSADLDGRLSYTHVQAYLGAAVFTADDGTIQPFLPKIALDGGISWAPPPGEDGWVTQTPAGVQLADGDGTIYQFDQSGDLASTYSSIDDRKNATATYEWAGDPARLQSITDPVSNRKITLTYGGGACGGQPLGFDPVPQSMLCKVDYWDGTTSYLRYKNGQFSRLEDPGGEVTDFGYGTNGLLSAIRDPLAADAVAAGVRADNDTTRTLITYDTANPPRVQTVTLAEPTAGAPRPQDTYTYGSGSTAVATAGLTGQRNVTYDDRARMLTDTDPTGRQSTTIWDPIKEQVTATVDPAGLESTTVYDQADRPTDTYGSAPQGWFNGNIPAPAFAAQTPHSITRWDEGMNGLGVAYYNNPQLGAPTVSHKFGFTGNGGTIDANWGSDSPLPGVVNADNWSAQLTGDITFAQAGIYHFDIFHDDGVRLYVDDKLVIDAWGPCACAHGGDFNNPTPGKTYRVRLDYQELSGNAALTLTWVPPGGSSQIVPADVLHPRYGLSTSKTDPDGKTTATQYADPALGQPTATIVDPAGLALTTTTGYEGIGTNQYRRRISKALPAGNQWTYQYYGKDAAETGDNPCPGGATGINQGGAQWKESGPDPDGDGSQPTRVEESVYSASGQVVATRINSGGWTCTSYDTRGRVTERTNPTFGAEPARTVTHNYGVNGNPLVTRVSDPAGAITTTVDLLGRTTSYTDVWNKTTTTTYDQAGRATDANGPAGAIHTAYDDADRVTSTTLDGQIIAVPSYDAAGRLDTVNHPSGPGNGGSGVSLDHIGRDALGRTTGLTWRGPNGGVVTSDTVSRALSGDITDESIDGSDADPAGPNFAYDAAGRLTSAKVPGHTISYNFDPSGGCGHLTTAGKNTNRTGVVDNGNATTYCYDDADKLTNTTTSGHANLAYDSHGNTTTVGTETLTYDGADRHTSSRDNGSTVTYTRDATDRIVARVVTGTNPATERYSYTGDGDTPDATLDSSNNVIERTISLPGGSLVSKRASGDVWSFPNVHGDIAAMSDRAGTKQGPTLSYDPYGQTLSGTPDNSQGSYDYGWLGQHQRGLEHQSGLQPIIEMGVRQYDPAVGRFLQVDPIEGGSANDYEYATGDPQDVLDLDGACSQYQPINGVIVIAPCPTQGRPTYSGRSPLQEEFRKKLDGAKGRSKGGKGKGRGKGSGGAGGSQGQAGKPKGGHTRGARGSTRGKHERGEARRRRDQGGEKGDARRRGNPNKRRRRR